MTSADLKGAPAPRLTLILLALIVAAGLGLRIWAAARNEFPTVDGVLYLDQTRLLLNEGRLPWSCFPPGWPAIAALPYAFLDRTEPMSLLRAAQAANVVMGTLMPLLAWFVMRRYLGAWVALIGLAVLMFLPADIVYSKNDLSEMAFTCTLLGGWLLWRRGADIAAGLVLGFAYLVRPEALLMTGGLALATWWRTRRIPWRLLVPMVVVMIPYLIFIRVQTGVFDLTSKTVAVSLSLEAHPGLGYIGLIFRNLGTFLPKLPAVLGLPIVLVALWGMIARRGAWLWLLAPLLPVPFIINPMDVRFWVPYLPVIVLAAGLGAQDLTERLGARRRWVPVLLAVFMLGGLGFAARNDVYWIKRNTEAFYGLRDAGLWLRDNTPPGTVIAAYKPYTAFWAGRPSIKYPDGMDATELVTWARNNGARYMVVNVKVVHSLVEELDPLLQSPLPPALTGRITLVELLQYDLVDHNTAIYRIENP